MRGVTVGGADYGAYVRRVEAVLKVVLLQKVGSGYRYRSELVKRQYRVPELIMPFKHQHYPVALLYA